VSVDDLDRGGTDIDRTATADPNRAGAPREARPPLVTGWSIAVVVLGGLAPFAAFLSTNGAKLVHPAPVFVAGMVWTALVGCGYVVLRAVTRSTRPELVAAGVVAANLSFWNFGRWLSSEPGSMGRRLIGLVLWTVVTGLAVVLAMKLARVAMVRTFIVTFLAIWIAASGISYASGATERGQGDAPTLYEATVGSTFQERPNVYWFVLDEHARTDQLRTWTDVDNSWFGDDLTDRGFSVSESTWAGYAHTHLSLSSTLAMDYAFTPGHDYRSEYALTAPLSEGDNPVVETFEANGYRYVYAPDGSVEWSSCPPASGDRACIEPLDATFGVREPYTQMLLSTPVGSFDLPITHNSLDSVLDGVDEIRSTTDQPLFVMGHVLSPHQPYRYEPGCSLRTEPVVGTKLSGEERAAAYANEVTCVDHDTVRAVDRVLASDPEAVIIIQSDHGSRLTFNWDQPYDEWTPAMLSERFGALNAVRLPAACRGDSLEGEPLVNTFRLVFACLTGDEPELLESRSFFSGYGQISTLVEVPPESLREP
jgi:hypothetical protein